METHKVAADTTRSSDEQLLDALAAETWSDLIERDPYYAPEQLQSYPRGDLAEAEAVAKQARARNERLQKIDISGMSRTDRLTAKFLGYWLDDEMKSPERWWTGFGVAPYTLSMLAVLPGMVFSEIDVTKEAEATRYLKLAGELASHVEVHRERLVAQAERGWRIPRPALANVRKTVEGIGSGVASVLRIDEARQADQNFRKAVDDLVQERIVPAFDRLLEALGPDYEAKAPDKLGLVHFPGGADAYRMWIEHHLGYAADPGELHKIGLAEVERLAAAMAKVRAEYFGHNGDEASFHERLRADPKAKASSAEALEATYKRHLDRMAPVFERLFQRGPDAPAKVERLAPALEAGMTFGYYEPPKKPGDAGHYYYSANGIPNRLQINAAALIFHELFPGHHVHVARQSENMALPDIRRKAFAFTGFAEGWAEYSAGLAEAEGLYDDPYDRYGWLVHQRFVAQRIVVDTGLNALGWSREQAIAYMSANTLEAPEQVASEILRYSTDMPGQALSYRVGFLKFRELRQRAEQQLGDSFVVADFHEAILSEGALPLSVLDSSLQEWADEMAS